MTEAECLNLLKSCIEGFKNVAECSTCQTCQRMAIDMHQMMTAWLDQEALMHLTVVQKPDGEKVQ